MKFLIDPREKLYHIEQPYYNDPIVASNTKNDSNLSLFKMVADAYFLFFIKNNILFSQRSSPFKEPPRGGIFINS